MAITKMWKVSDRLDNTINYVVNGEKTEQMLYVSGINCLPDTAVQEMKNAKEQFFKTKGIQCFHGVQSFAEGEVTADTAHEIGVKLAEELWGDKFQVVVTTHLNTNHIHNHIVVNSVSFVDGKRYSNTKADIGRMRITSDKLCEDYGLQTLKKEEKYNKYVSSSSYKIIMRDSVDYAISIAKDYNEFIKILKDLDYTITDDKGTISLKRKPYKRTTRIEKQFGKAYSIKNIKKRILEEQPEYPYSPANYILAYRAYDEYFEWKKNENQYTSKLAILILGYDKVFGFKNKIDFKPNITKMTPELIHEIKELDKFSEGVRLVCKYDLKTEEDVISFKQQMNEKINPLKSERENLWRKHKRAKIDEDKKSIEEQIANISKKITPLVDKIRICDNILERAERMKQYELKIQLLKERQENEKSRKKQVKKNNDKDRQN